jgi:hypothetical protein
MPKLCKAGIQLREQIDDAFPDRSRISDGWIGDARHQARKSDHNPDAQGWVRAIDVSADLGDKATMFDLADQLRLLARFDSRISYIIYNGKIASWRGNYKWRAYKGINPHKIHMHVSFTAKGDEDGSMFKIPLLTGEPINGTSKKTISKLGAILSRRLPSDLSDSRVGSGSDNCKRSGCNCACHPSLA